MSEPFLGEIRMFAGNFAPRGWAFCDGQLLAVSSNDALFSLFGTIYGGDGRTTFGLPDLRGRVPIHQGSGPGLSPRNIGAKGGAEAVTVTAAQVPVHSHDNQVSSVAGGSTNPDGEFIAASPGVRVYRPAPPNTTLNAGSVGNDAGGGQPHGNIQPIQVVNFIVALVGTYPSRN